MFHPTSTYRPENSFLFSICLKWEWHHEYCSFTSMLRYFLNNSHPRSILFDFVWCCSILFIFVHFRSILKDAHQFSSDFGLKEFTRVKKTHAISFLCYFIFMFIISVGFCSMVEWNPFVFFKMKSLIDLFTCWFTKILNLGVLVFDLSPYLN